MRTLAIDPGYDRCGVAILERENGREKLLHSECLQTDKSLPFNERLSQVGVQCEELCEKFEPKALALEKVYFNTNQKTAIQIAQVYGVLTFLATRRGMDVYEYTPPQIKSAITSSGKADKKQIMLLIPKLIRIEKNITLDDEYDAIAIGLTHLAHVRA